MQCNGRPYKNDKASPLTRKQSQILKFSRAGSPAKHLRLSGMRLTQPLRTMLFKDVRNDKYPKSRVPI
jgi:hypothetical protein